MLNRKNKVLKVTGGVQGVCYRASTCQIANEIEIKGYVMNMPDGSVFIEAEGSEEQLNKMIEWCKQGPKNALVNELNIQEGTVKGFIEFKIHY